MNSGSRVVLRVADRASSHLLVLHSILRPMLCVTGSAVLSLCCSMASILGRKSRQSELVVEKRMSTVLVTKARVARSLSRLASTTTRALVMTTLYTLSPMYCESFSAGILTCLWNRSRYKVPSNYPLPFITSPLLWNDSNVLWHMKLPTFGLFGSFIPSPSPK